MRLFFTLFLVVNAVNLTVEAVTPGQLLKFRAFWPSEVTITKGGALKLYSSGGSLIGEHTVQAGDVVPMKGVFRQGVGLEVAGGIAFIHPDSTDIVAQIKQNPAYQVKKRGQRLSEGIKKLIDDDLIDKNKKKQSRDLLAGKYVGVYFSAHWCPPCRAFTPQLVAFRDKHKAEFEVVFVTSDRSTNDQIEYMKSTGMNWLATPYDSEAGSKLKKHFAVRGIPKLIILNPEGKVVTEDGRSDVMQNGDEALAGWKK